ncbi:MAG: VanW family protein [Tissierellia bacterium]|nr:VanW family protein [Tissierellia bacterium]
MDMDRIKEKFSKGPILALGLVVVLLVGGIFAFFYWNLTSDSLVYGTRFQGAPLGGKTRQEVALLLDKYEEEKREELIAIQAGSKKDQLKLSDLGYDLNQEASLDQAFSLGKKGPLSQRLAHISKGLFGGYDLDLKESLDSRKRNLYLADLAKEVDRDPVDAQIRIKGEGPEIDILPAQEGRRLDIEASKKVFEDWDFKTLQLDLPVETRAAEIQADHFKGITGVLSSFSTNYSSSEANRKDNIALASSLTSGLLLKPGQGISFLETIGDITSANGFKTAGVIINGDFDRGVGGGVCQVSTTLYNALVRADLEITERHNHSRPIGYVPNGTDAAVVEGYKDLKFKNNKEDPIFIMATANGDDLTYQVLGNKEAMDYEIDLVPESLGSYGPRTITKQTSALYQGEQKVENKGAAGSNYQTWKVKLVDGKEVERTLLNKSAYVPRDRVVLVGTRPVVQETPSQEEGASEQAE